MCYDADWQIGLGEPNSFKSVTAFYPEDQTSSSNGIHGNNFMVD